MPKNVKTKHILTAEDRTGRAFEKAKGGLKGMQKAALLTGAALGTLGMARLATDIVQTTSEFQRLSAMLKVATGSSARAAVAFEQIKIFATETPFTVGQVTQAFLTLKNLGLDPSMESLRAYGNVAASMGKDVQQFIEAVADASVGEFERLKEFGIKASKQGDEISFRFRGATTTVKNTSEEIQGFLRDIGQNEFAGAMAEQMKTIDGAISNAGVAIDGLAVAFGTVLAPTIIEVADALVIAADGMRAFLAPTTADEINNINKEIEALSTSLFDMEEARTFHGGYEAEIDFAEKRIAQLERERDALTKVAEEKKKVFEDIVTGPAAAGGDGGPAAAGSVFSPTGAFSLTGEGSGGVGGFSLTGDGLTPTDQIKLDSTIALNSALANLDMARTEAALDEATSRMAIDQREAAAKRQTVGLLRNMLDGAAEGSKKAFKVQQGVAIAEATIDTYKAATGAYSAMAGIPIVGPALGAAAAAAAIAVGLANVKRIKSQRFGGGGGGGGGGGAVSAGGVPATGGAIDQPQQALPVAGKSLTVVVEGNLIGEDEWVENNLIPTLDDALSKRNVTLVASS
jgi:hypothetical protein